MENYYDLLGVQRGASQDEIKKAFRKKAHQYHPDKKDGDEAMFKKVNEAYQTLSNEQKRASYDRFGHSAYTQSQSGGGAPGGYSWHDFAGGAGMGGVEFDLGDLGDMVGDMFGFGGRRRRKGPQQGQDIAIEFSLDFETALFGTEKEVQIEKTTQCKTCKGNGAEPGTKINICTQCNGSGQVMKVHRTILGHVQSSAPCPTCEGQGNIPEKKCNKCNGKGIEHARELITIKIPAGVANGTTLRITGQGHAGEKGAPPGNLYATVHVRSHEVFTRDGNDLRMEVEIPITSAVLGDTMSIETLDGKYDLKIPAGTQSGQVFRMRDLGVPYIQKNGRGDLLVHAQIATPTKLSKQQKKLLEELKKEGL